MKTHHRCSSVGLALGLAGSALLAAGPAGAYVFSAGIAQYHAQTYLINPNFTDPRSGTQAQQIAAIQNGANDWNNQADYLYTYGGQTAVNVTNALTA